MVAVILVCAALVPVLPGLIYGMPAGVDFGFHLRLARRFSTAAEFLKYPGWNGEANFGYGEMTFRLYPLGLPFLLTVAHKLTGDWVRGVTLAWGLLSFCGVWGAFRFARVYVPDRLALWAGIFWAAMPYSNLEIYESSLLADFAANAILPHVFAGVARICRFGKAEDVFPCALVYGLLLNTHVPTGVIGSLSIGVLSLATLAVTPSEHRRDRLVRLILALALGGMAGLRFLAVLMSEAGWIYPIGNPPRRMYLIEENFLSLSPDSLLGATIGIIFVITVGVALPAFIGLFAPRNLFRAALPAFLLACFAAFLMMPASRPIWLVVPRLKDIQFPWRWLTVISATVCIPATIGFGVILRRIGAGGRDRLIWFPLIGVVVACASYNLVFGIFHARVSPEGARIALKQPPDYPEYFTYVPMWAYRTGTPPPPMTVPARAGERSLAVERLDPAYRKLRVGAGPAGPLRVRCFFHPYWHAFVDGVPVPVGNGADGVLTVGIPERETLVELRFIEPWPVQAAGWISLLAGIAAGGGTLVRQVRRRQWKRG